MLRDAFCKNRDEYFFWDQLHRALSFTEDPSWPCSLVESPAHRGDSDWRSMSANGWQPPSVPGGRPAWDKLSYGRLTASHSCQHLTADPSLNLVCHFWTETGDYWTRRQGLMQTKGRSDNAMA